MSAEDLLDEEAFDPKKLFNQEEYSTLIIKRDGFSNRQNSDADLVESLLDRDNTRAEDEAIFKLLKEAKARPILMEAIRSTEKNEFRAKLVAACWESGLDFNSDILFFVDLACDKDFQIAMEAMTVIDVNDDSIDNETLQKAIDVLLNEKSGHEAIKNDLIGILKGRMNV